MFHAVIGYEPVMGKSVALYLNGASLDRLEAEGYDRFLEPAAGSGA